MSNRLKPTRWPVRWRLATASAALTFMILVVFAGVVGNLAADRVRDDFSRDLESAATGIAARTQILATPGGGFIYQGPVLNSVAAANQAVIRIVAADGTVIRETPGAEVLGTSGFDLTPSEPFRTATATILNDGRTVGFVQYARSVENIDSTIARIWLFIAAGVVGGTLLASFSGLAIADRAMRPIAALTGRAQQIAATRDPSLELPQPKADDEVGKLTQTLAEMLKSLDSARTEREQALVRQREFLADASHELRTPLTSVLANLELLQETQGDSMSQDPATVESALRSSRRMSRLVTDLLILARADAGRQSPRTDLDLAAIAGDAAAEVAPMLGTHSLKVTDLTPAAVYGSRDELHRLVVNLLDNAIKHTPTGSVIELKAGSGEGSTAWLEVSDSGPGVPEEIQDQVFDRFVRSGASADTSHGNGTGLGLAIVRSVAEAHYGKVTVRKSHLGGAAFRLELPILGTHTETSDPAEAPAHRPV